MYKKRTTLLCLIWCFTSAVSNLIFRAWLETFPKQVGSLSAFTQGKGSAEYSIIGFLPNGLLVCFREALRRANRRGLRSSEQSWLLSQKVILKFFQNHGIAGGRGGISRLKRHHSFWNNSGAAGWTKNMPSGGGLPLFMDTDNLLPGRKMRSKVLLTKVTPAQALHRKESSSLQKDCTRSHQGRQGCYGQESSFSGQILTPVFRASAEDTILKPCDVVLNQDRPLIFLHNLWSDLTENMHSNF